MKLVMATLLIAVNIFLISCKKDRTCNCSYQTTTTYDYVAQDGSATSNTVTTSSGSQSETYAKVKKDDLKRLFDCNNRTESGISTYTTELSVPTVTSFGGITFTTYVSGDYNVTEKNSTEYTCEIK